MTVEVRLLELFLRVAELGSINKAAASVHLSQPALSRHIALLEHQMGNKLFIRTPGGVDLTEAGKMLSDRARPLLRQLTLLKEQVGEKASGQLAIGTPPAWQQVVTSPFVEKLAGRHPGITLRVYEGISNILREYMSARLLDIAIVPYDPSPTASYRKTPLVREPMVLVGRREDALHPEKPVALSRLDGLRLVLPGRPNVARIQIEHALERKGMQFRLAVETDTLSLCLDLARRGVGYAVVPASSVFEHGLGDAISWGPIKGQFVTWALCENLDRTHSQAVREGRALLIKAVSDALELKVWARAERPKAKA
ncbi:LysR family transcriptional regulator [Bradyrhizobium sp. USDA 336]|uniref:LysR family transcriptional regulator n=1 Tax=Bradyrhizobium sp. USDA 336 TaxID=3156311 RepID=UPI00383312F2